LQKLSGVACAPSPPRRSQGRLGGGRLSAAGPPPKPLFRPPSPRPGLRALPFPSPLDPRSPVVFPVTGDGRLSPDPSSSRLDLTRLWPDAWRRQGLSTWLGAAVSCRSSAAPPAVVCLVVLVAALAAPLLSLRTVSSAGSSMCARRSVAGYAQHGDGQLGHRRRPCAWLRLVPTVATLSVLFTFWRRWRHSVPFASLEALLRSGPFLPEGVILRNFPCCCCCRRALGAFRQSAML